MLGCEPEGAEAPAKLVVRLPGAVTSDGGMGQQKAVSSLSYCEAGHSSPITAPRCRSRLRWLSRDGAGRVMLNSPGQVLELSRVGAFHSWHCAHPSCYTSRCLFSQQPQDLVAVVHESFVVPYNAL